MKLISTGIASGKTHRCITSLKENPRSLLLVSGSEERRRLIQEFKLVESDARRIMTFSDFSDNRAKGIKTNEVLVDGVDRWIQQLIYRSCSSEGRLDITCTASEWLIERANSTENSNLPKEWLDQFSETTPKVTSGGKDG